MMSSLVAGEQYNAWMLTKFTQAQRDAGLADPTLDPDGDGSINIWEYVYGCDPMNAAACSAPVGSDTGNAQAVTFRLLRGIEDLEWKVQMSNDLANWVDNTDAPTQTPDGAVDVTTVTNSTYHFFRIHVAVKDGFTVDSDLDTVDDFFEYEMINESPTDELAGLPDVNATNDQDSDGLTDVQEFGFQMDRYDKLDVLTDVDGDRIPNWFEYKRGSDIVDAASKPLIDATVDPQNVDVANGIYATIQAAIDAVPSTQNSEPYYGVIRVVPGVYQGENVIPSDKRITFLADQGQGGVLLTSKKTNMDILNVASPMTVFDGFVITKKGATNIGYLPVWFHPVSNDDVLRLYNCIIRESISKWGAVLVDKGVFVADHVTITQIQGGRYSAAIYMGWQTQLHLRNSIVWGNRSAWYRDQIGLISGGFNVTVSVRDSWIEGGELGANAQDPQLTPNGLLTHNSPARDACAAIDNRLGDIHGEPLQGGADAGADEFGDSDTDNLPDFWEIKYGGLAMAATGDTDDGVGDMLTNLDEYRYGCSPLLIDTDGDGRADGAEVTSGMSPHISVRGFLDADGDRIPNVFEDERGSDALLASSMPSIDAVVDPANVALPNTYASLQEAIDAVPSYDANSNPYYAIVRVVAGEHQGEFSIPSNKQICFLADQGVQEVVIQTTADTGDLVTCNSMISSFDGFVFSPGSEAYDIGNVIYQNSSFFWGMLRLKNCIIRDFEVKYYEPISAYYGSIMLDHVTVTGMHTTSDAEAKLLGLWGSDSDLYLRNTILWGNTGYPTKSIYQDATALNEVSMMNSWVEGGELGAFDYDPRIVPEGYLLSGSLARDAGVILDGSSKDIHGENYVMQPDAGADEYLDTDGDGRPDWLQPGSHFLADLNGDGVPLWDALNVYGIDDELLDYDRDGIPNDYEIAQGWDPAVANPESDFASYLTSITNTPSFTVFTELK